MFNFPTSPALGQKFTIGSKMWSWNGYAWDLQVVSRAAFDSYVQHVTGLEDEVTAATKYANALAGKEFYPFVLDYTLPPTSSTTAFVLPPVTVQFYKGKFDVPGMTYNAPTLMIVDVWINDAGAYVFEACAYDAYNSLPRHDNWLHMYRLQTSATKIQGIYQRFGTYPTIKRGVARPYGPTQFKDLYSIPTAYVNWVDGAAVTRGTVYKSAGGDLWKCEDGGVCASAPAAPTYEEDLNSGFSIEISGNAPFTFRGRSAYSGALRTSPRGGVQWYFANIAAGLMAGKCPVECKAHIQAALFHMADNWVPSAYYFDGSKVAGALTQGRVWEAQIAGQSGVASTFPAAAAINSMHVDGSVTWKCIGICAHTDLRMFWYDTEPTMRAARSPDSHDSYAATLVWAVWRYMDANPTDTAWLSVATKHPNGKTVLGLLQDILYFNLHTQLNGATLLSNTFQYNKVPGGGMYAANFFMDNCEVYAGFLAAERLWGNAAWGNNAPFSAYNATFKNDVLTGLESLWEKETGTYKYIAGLPSMAPTVPGKANFYPLCMSQAWGALWGVPLYSDRIEKCFKFMGTHYPMWWARNDMDDLLAFGSHYAHVLYSGSCTAKIESLRRAETERFKSDQADVYVMDIAYYISMRDSVIVRDLSYKA